VVGRGDEGEAGVVVVVEAGDQVLAGVDDGGEQNADSADDAQGDALGVEPAGAGVDVVKGAMVTVELGGLVVIVGSWGVGRGIGMGISMGVGAPVGHCGVVVYRVQARSGIIRKA
jgi:hypothetical protein